MSKKLVPRENRPNVSLIYSESTAGSKESKHLAYYLCGQLASTGYANMHMVGLTSDGMPAANLPSSSSERITYMSRGNSTKKIEVPASDVTFSHFDILAQSHVIIVTVNSEDTKLCRNKMQQILDEKRQNKGTKITIFSLQRGGQELAGNQGRVRWAQGHCSYRRGHWLRCGAPSKEQSLHPYSQGPIDPFRTS